MLGVLALTIERFVTYEKKFYNLTDQANVSIAFKCTEWYCTADFTFALVVLINLRKCNNKHHSLAMDRSINFVMLLSSSVLVIGK